MLARDESRLPTELRPHLDIRTGSLGAAVRDILGAATGRLFELTLITDDEVRQGARAMGMSERGADGLVGMTAGLRALEPEQPRTAMTTTPTTLAGWAYDVLRPLLTD